MFALTFLIVGSRVRFWGGIFFKSVFFLAARRHRFNSPFCSTSMERVSVSISRNGRKISILSAKFSKDGKMDDRRGSLLWTGIDGGRKIRSLTCDTCSPRGFPFDSRCHATCRAKEKKKRRSIMNEQFVICLIRFASLLTLPSILSLSMESYYDNHLLTEQSFQCGKQCRRDRSIRFTLA